MAKPKRQKDLVSRFADAGEEAFQLISAAPGADRVLGSALGVMHNMREQIETLSRRVRGIEELEQRVAKLERELANLSRSSSAARSSRKAPTAGSSSSSQSSAGAKRSSSRSTKKKT